MINPMELTGKHVLITGASSGIGKATAIHLSKLGAKLSLIARDEERLKETMQHLEGEGHNYYSFDLTELEKIENLIKGIVNKKGSFGGFVHCAGIATMRPLMLTKPEFLHDMMVINFYSYIELIRCLSKKKNYLEGASFIGISSVAANEGIKSKIAYCSSKAAMDSATRCIAKELASKNIRANTILPGFINTDLLEDYLETAGEDALESNVASNQYLGIGEVVDIANAIAFLLSDASKFITGTGLVVDGGYLS